MRLVSWPWFKGNPWKSLNVHMLVLLQGLNSRNLGAFIKFKVKLRIILLMRNLGTYVDKVQFFWEGHKNLPNLHLLEMSKPRQNHKEDCSNFCGLLRKAELYVHILVFNDMNASISLIQSNVSFLQPDQVSLGTQFQIVLEYLGSPTFKDKILFVYLFMK